MTSVFLSDTELYYTSPRMISNDQITIEGEEVHHITKVMRHTPGDELYITDGAGTIYTAEIIDIKSDNLKGEVKRLIKYENEFSNVIFCLPKLKNPDRFEFALEKCVELGITNFIVYQAANSVSKGEKADRWNKILLAAMKQSLRSYLPKISYESSLQGIMNLEGRKIILDQNSEGNITDIKSLKDEKYYFIFGPEGGFSKKETDWLTGSDHYKLTPNRLRSETAIITTAALISTKL